MNCIQKREMHDMSLCIAGAALFAIMASNPVPLLRIGHVLMRYPAFLVLWFLYLVYRNFIV
jgi:hypothetical protein